MSNKIKKLFFGILILALLFSLRIFIPQAYALSSCPEGASFQHGKFGVAKASPVTGSVILSGNSLNNITRILLSWGDGTTVILPLQNPTPSGDYKFATSSHPYNQVGDFIPYIVLGDDSNWMYICYGTTIPVYYLYQGGFGNVTLKDPGTPASVTFNANTQFGGDNIIGYYSLGQVTHQGIGGLFATDPLKLTIDQWETSLIIFADPNPNDSNPEFSYSYGSYPAFHPLYLSQRSNLITLRVTKPANTWINGSIVSSPAPSASVNLASGQAVYWRPKNVSQPPTPTPPGNVFSAAIPSQTPTPIVSGWTFPSRVFDQSTNKPVTDVILKLYGSNDGVNKTGPLATCSKASWDGEKCRPTLFTTSFYKWYFVKKEGNPTGFVSSKAVCATPAISYPTTNYNCQVVDANTVKWGGKYGYHTGTKGYYSWSDFFVKKP